MRFRQASAHKLQWLLPRQGTTYSPVFLSGGSGTGKSVLGRTVVTQEQLLHAWIDSAEALCVGNGTLKVPHTT